MSTAIKLGTKTYRAAPLTVAEAAGVSRALAAMEKATAEEDFEGVTATLKAIRQILFIALQNANSQITAEQMEAMPPNKIMMAIGQLSTASRQAVA